MNTISIDGSLYNSAKEYAQQHHTNVSQVVEAGLRLLFNQIGSKSENIKSVWDKDEYQKAMAYLDTLTDKTGKPVPDDEDGREAR